MNKSFAFSFFLLLILYACGQNTSYRNTIDNTTAPDAIQSKIDVDENTIATRFLVPEGFERTKTDSTSFANYLRNLPLKPDGHLVKYYNGQTKPNENVYAAVVNLPIGKRDLHQCADAVMRLRAEYLYEQERYGDIHFNFTNGFKADYATWRKGNRIAVNGNKVKWVARTEVSDSYTNFWKYLEMVFSYAGTASLEKELNAVVVGKMQIGDVFIRGGFPGHAVIVVDMAKNNKTGESIFLLAQSYMPAQEIQILNNPNNGKSNPWYRVSQIDTELRTPEWVFTKNSLKRFTD
ncbi:DUF4846 domain-containing protein [Costertonia aggregata]|uniref:DUF4846 domain-containing protein n=1 Tax=Costertonia aggregata TaxID=343403 RepID=A0A7H9AMA2_9FLAO|nr:DUF4846 domain-containing protein [Costertonia aggregata]QLG44415.1 DUF4846 domain-containing protein [Costertonia aggregata]